MQNEDDIAVPRIAPACAALVLLWLALAPRHAGAEDASAGSMSSDVLCHGNGHALPQVRLGYPTDRAPLASGSGDAPRGAVAALLPLLPLERITLHPGPAATLHAAAAEGRLDAVIGLPPRSLPASWRQGPIALRVPNGVASREGDGLILQPHDLRHRRVAVLDPLPPSVAGLPGRILRARDAAHALAMLHSGQVDAVVANVLLLADVRPASHDDGLVINPVAGFDDVLGLSVAPDCSGLLLAYERQWMRSPDAARRAVRQAVAVHGTAPGWMPSLALLGAVAALGAIGLLHARGYARLRDAGRRRRQLQRRVEEVTGNLPVVVFQAQRARDGRLAIDMLAGDTPQLFSASPNELRDDPSRLLAAVCGRDRKRVMATLLRAVTRTQPVDLRFRAAGVRGLRSVRMRAWPMLDGAGRQHWSGYWMDVSDADSRERAIQQAHADAARDADVRGQWVSTLGLGISAPMRNLLRHLQTLQREPLDARQRAALAALEDAATMLERILQDVAALSVGDGPAMALQCAPVDVPGLVRSVDALLRPIALSKSLEMRLHLDECLAGRLMGDGTRLRQILFNLVGNAIKFTEQGYVSLHVQVMHETASAQQLRIEVADSGIGIAPERQQAIFTPFAQAGVATARTHGGTGLGLGICRQLVRAMGGQLRLHSEPARGTRVVLQLWLPRAAAAAPPAVSPRQAAQGMVPAAGTPPARVLVVEDHPTQQLLMQWWLRGLQLEVDVASDGEQAFAAWKTGRPDLVFTDDRMPGQGGGGLVQAIRQHERDAGWPPVPIIGMSAEPDHMRWMAVDHVLAKPITARRLREAIRRVMPALPLVEPSPAGALAGQACDDAVPAVPAVPPLAVLAQRFGSAAVAAELVCTLRCSLEEDLHALQAAWADADADAGEKAAAQCLHRMAGGLGSLGLVELARWLRELNESDRPTCTAHRARIQSRLQDCIAQLNQLENDNPPADTAATGTVASRPPQAPPAGSAC